MIKMLAPLAICGALLFAPLDASATPVVSTDGGSLAVTNGNTYTVNVLIQGAVDLYAYQFSVSYDSTVLSVQDSFNPATEGSFLTNVYSAPGQTAFFAGFDDGVGNISFIADTLVGPLAGVSGDGTLASITFVAVADGTTSVSAFFNADNGDTLLTSDELAPPVAVPEPATLLLVGVGSAAIAGRRSRRRARRS